ncbi:MAG: transposase [Planctomycetales bacterium]
MPRTARVTPGGMVFHVLNRGVGRQQLFAKAEDYAAFEEIIAETLQKCPMRICAYCLMPNHCGDWPLPRPRQWLDHVNRQQTEAELNAIRKCVARGQPLGTDR